MSGTSEDGRDPLPAKVEPRAGRPATRAQATGETSAQPASAGQAPARQASAGQVSARQASAGQASARPASSRQQIGIRELRQHASVYVDLAERGYTVDITNRGRLVAQLVPAHELDSPLERLIAAGIIESAEEPGGVADIEPYPAAGRPSASEVLGQAREDERQ
jgi:prevent-host-death family protein